VPDNLDKCPDTPSGVQVDASGCPVAKRVFEEGKKSLVLEAVNFETNKATLTAESRAILDKVAESLRAYPEVKVEVQGHTDNRGSKALNTKLSQARAETVRDYLIGKGIAADRLTARGYGPTRPIADNKTDAGRAQNRRVQLERVE
jgi:OOP family OmpA-OmpF porin